MAARCQIFEAKYQVIHCRWLHLSLLFNGHILFHKSRLLLSIVRAMACLSTLNSSPTKMLVLFIWLIERFPPSDSVRSIQNHQSLWFPSMFFKFHNFRIVFNFHFYLIQLNDAISCRSEAISIILAEFKKKHKKTIRWILLRPEPHHEWHTQKCGHLSAVIVIGKSTIIKQMK